MRILHTSDWHLGVSIRSQSCEKEQQRFLSWLADEIRDRAIDVLIVAGDVFHYATPSNTARRMYYEFLVDCASISGLEQVIVVGGNHDSPSGLDAPRELLESLDIHVVGGLPYDEAEQIERCLVSVDQGKELVVAAVPYARRAQLGVALEDDSDRAMHRRYQAAFKELYERLERAARDRYPGADRVATGHLTCYGASNEPAEGDYHSAIHGTVDTREIESVGSIGAMGPAIFGDGYDYVALGHIHRMMRVGEEDVWYSGTPVATSVDEGTRRYVLQVDFGDDEPPDVEPIQVPTWRRVLRFEGTEEEIAEELAAIERTAPLPPYLFLRVEVDRSEQVYAESERRLLERLEEEFPDSERRPRIAECRNYDPNAEPMAFDDQGPSLEELSPREVFVKRYRSKVGSGEDPPEELLEAFDEVRQEFHDSDDWSE